MTDTPSNYGYAPLKKVGRVCLLCGAHVADTDAHDKFHEWLLDILRQASSYAKDG